MTHTIQYLTMMELCRKFQHDVSHTKPIQLQTGTLRLMHHPHTVVARGKRPRCYSCSIVNPARTTPSGKSVLTWIFPLIAAPFSWILDKFGKNSNFPSSFQCDTVPPDTQTKPSRPASQRPFTTWGSAQPEKQPTQDYRQNKPSEPSVDKERRLYDDNNEPDDDEPDNGNNQPDSVAEVELSDVHLTLGDKQVLRGLNIEIHRGEALAIIGTSGTGKSTTLRLISGLLMPTQGSVKLRGEPRVRSLIDTYMTFSPPMSEEELRRDKTPRISMAFQNSALFDSLTINENIELALEQHTRLKPDTEAMSRVVRLWLARVGLNSEVIGDKLPDKLSGGMKKRVSFARAVCFDPSHPHTAPDVLLYDEPTAGLDSFNSTIIENLICDLRQFCPTCVVVTHQFSTIRRTSDRVVFLHGGRKVWDGPTDTLDATDNPYIRQFLSASLEGPLTEEMDALESFLGNFEEQRPTDGET